MTRSKLRFSFIVLSTLGLGLACTDRPKSDGGGGSETGDSADTNTTNTTNDTNDTNDSHDGHDSNDTGDGDTGDGDGDTGDGDTGDGDTGDGDPQAECGNGVIDPGEECDDGDENGPEFACLDDCTLNVCGDGFVGPEEGCDDGNNIDGDGCSADCLIENAPPAAMFCGNKLYECGDTIDNDMDGFIDLADPECISPCDDDESTFKTNLPGQNKDCKGDCYFDSNSGSGDDKCVWNLKCDPLNPGGEIGCEYDPNLNPNQCSLEVPQQCHDVCGPLVPNGCDCFGCCEIEGQFIYLDGAHCSLATLDQCASCTFHENCNNPCVQEECELCFGQTLDDLPPGCDAPGCPVGVTSCATEADCGEGQFCQTGCCTSIIPQ